MLSGIKAHTFRIWEQRHGLRFCKRKESQHRYYDNEDLKAVLRIAYLYHRGYKVSKIAHLSKEEIIKLAMGDMANANYDLFVHQLIEATIDYNQPLFEKILKASIADFGFERSIAKIFYPFMQRVGLLWVTEHLIPAQEHFSSTLIMQKMLVAIDGLRSVGMNKKYSVLIFAPEGEFHEIPLLIAQYLFKKSAIKTVYFGVNIPVAELEYYCSNKSVTHLYINIITNFLNKGLAEYLKCLTDKFPDIKILVSGPAIKPDASFASSVKIVGLMEELVTSL